MSYQNHAPCSFFLCVVIFISTTFVTAADAPFRRGDVNDDASIDISDPIVVLGYLFLGAHNIDCLDSADTNDDGSIDVGDPVYLLDYIFSGGPMPPDPGPMECGLDPTLDSIGCFHSSCDGSADPARLAAGHLLHRITYGPRPGDVDQVLSEGIDSYLNAQLNPATGIEPNNPVLAELEQLFTAEIPVTDETFRLRPNAPFRYFLGFEEPPANWAQPGFDDSSWPTGTAGFGRGDNDDVTEFDEFTTTDLASIYIRTEFILGDPAFLPELYLKMLYDDAFVAYVNGVEIARSVRSNGNPNLVGNPPPHNQYSDGSHESGIPEYYSIPASLLQPGFNTLAIQGHDTPNSSDFTLDPSIVSQIFSTAEPRQVILSDGNLQRFTFIRGIYSQRQLKTVLGEFWENHFTTDEQKLRDLFRELRNRYGFRILGSRTAGRLHSSTLEFEEYDFFRENALGYFGDLLLSSAGGVPMLIYLDNILNFAAEPNENYSREILELHTLGVDNGYTQADIEQLARVFTGWTFTRIPNEMVQGFPDYITNPVTTDHHSWIETPLIEIGEEWKYLKGTEEPTPDALGEPTTGWAQPGFDDSTWLTGPTGIGMGDNDDATVLDDMENNYISFYARKAFTVNNPATPDRLELEVDYDDGVVLYLNGTEIGRSSSMNGRGTPPPFTSGSGNHEANGRVLRIDLDHHRSLMVTGTNVLAAQVHNRTITNGDCSFLPRVTSNVPTSRHIDLNNRQGRWEFRFNPDQHDFGPKTIFAGTPYQIDIPGDRLGTDGVLDGIDVIDALAAHPGTAEFICIKLIQRFVSDEISLATVSDGTAPLELQGLLANMIASWFSTARPGHIGTVLETLFDPSQQQGPFWDLNNARSKVKTPIEFINSTLRSLNANASTDDLVNLMRDMGMNLFQRDEPDGFSEIGLDWIGTTTLLERVNFARRFASNVDNDYRWTVENFVDPALGLGSVEVIEIFDEVLFQGSLTEAEKCVVIDYLETDLDGLAWPLNPDATDYLARIRDMVGFMLSMPRWQFQ
ncbi:MAG: DUF1800 family protein [Planctomycetota bacterium]|nr:DUF1800 family protein [Planctomycetota bacterium]